MDKPTVTSFDLPKRLRELAGQSTNEPSMVVRHAADEIERLTKELVDLRAAYLLATEAAESMLGMRSIDPSDVAR